MSESFHGCLIPDDVHDNANDWTCPGCGLRWRVERHWTLADTTVITGTKALMTPSALAAWRDALRGPARLRAGHPT
jgi:hypothetical protein